MKLIIRNLITLSVLILILAVSCSENNKNSEIEKYEEKLEREAEEKAKEEAESKEESFEKCMSGTTYAGYRARRNRCNNEIN